MRVKERRLCDEGEGEDIRSNIKNTTYPMCK